MPTQILWSTGNYRYFWVNSNADVSGLSEAMFQWESISNIRYIQANTIEEAQLIFVNSTEYKTVFNIDGFIGHTTTITHEDGSGRIAYITIDPIAIEVSINWNPEKTFTHELWHPEGAIDNPGGISIFNYENSSDKPSQEDIFYAQQWHGANPENDTVSLGLGSAPYKGGFGDDIIYGNQGADIIYGNQDNDIIYGGQDNDILYGGQGDDIIYGNQGTDIIYGNLGDDILYGNNDNLDILFGGQGDDILYHGIMFGNLGADTFHIFSEEEFSNIMDFKPEEGDIIIRDWLYI